MRHVFALVASPLLVASTVALVVAYSSPSELYASLQPVDTSVNLVEAGGPNVQDVVKDIAGQLPASAARNSRANADCFTELAQADEAKLERCAKVVYQALIEFDRQHGSDVMKTPYREPDAYRAGEQLRNAAYRICRDYWTKKPVDKRLFDSPACTVAQIQIASEAP